MEVPAAPVTSGLELELPSESGTFAAVMIVSCSEVPSACPILRQGWPGPQARYKVLPYLLHFSANEEAFLPTDSWLFSL